MSICQVADVIESAEKLGLKVIRMWAFNDGDGWNALQPRIGQIDDHVLRCCRALHLQFCITLCSLSAYRQVNLGPLRLH